MGYFLRSKWSTVLYHHVDSFMYAYQFRSLFIQINVAFNVVVNSDYTIFQVNVALYAKIRRDLKSFVI